ncbi:disease resistance protein RPP13-like [Carex rostrata]
MAEGIVSFVLEKLSDAVVQEILLLHGIDKQVETLSGELSWIQTFLKDADMKKLENKRQKLWVKLVQDVAYDIEDVIDNAFISKVPVPNNPLREFPRRGCFRIVEAAKRTWSKSKKLPALHNLAHEMNEIMARIQKISERRQIYGINFLGEGSGEQLRLPIRPPVLPDIDDPDVVGFNLDRDNIINQLLNTRTKRRVVISIVGPGGLGKTTLAQKVYNSNDVKRHFDVRIWVVISQEFDLKDVLRKIIKHVEPQSNLEGEEEYLLTKLYKTLNDEKARPKKYLLVLDDIWASDPWTQIERGLPDAMNGSRVIITSRFSDVAKGAEPYYPPYLTKEQSLELFYKKALPNRDLCEGYPIDLIEVARKFVQKCGGLPLALVVIGGLLSKKPATYVAWSKMLKTINWGNEGRKCIQIIATSYDDLPLVLKYCFMYFAIFPEDHEIDAQRLLRLWVAERLIPVEDSRTLEETAESFLEDLVQRSLVQVSQRSHTGSIVSCRIHDLLREVVIQRAKEDNFLTIFSNSDNQKSDAKARRVAVHYSGCNELMEHANPKLRSFLCFEKPLPSFSRHRLLKVLSDMGQCQGQGVEFECFNGLTQLRYCELSGILNSIGRSFELFIGSLKLVETLDFHLGEHGDLPNDIWNVKTLRHVMLRRYSLGPSSSADLRNLQTLTGVRSNESWNTQLPNLPNVRDLDILVESSFSWDLIAQLLDTLKHLTCLHLFGHKVPPEIVNMQRFSFYQHLQSLYLVDRSPSPSNLLPVEIIMFPKHVTELTLVGLQFKEDPMPVLEKLCNLKMLCLEGEEANRRMSCSAGGFQQLHQLNFVSLKNLEEWEIKEDAMSILEIVTLDHCSNLRVPLGLQYLSNLKELKVNKCSDLEKHAKKIHNICKDVPSISIDGFKPSISSADVSFDSSADVSSFNSSADLSSFNSIYFVGFLFLVFVSVLLLSFSFRFNLFVVKN